MATFDLLLRAATFTLAFAVAVAILLRPGRRRAHAYAAFAVGGIGAFMTIGQAVGVPNGRPNAAKYLHDYVEEQKANGFVARKLAESGNADATVAPAAK